MKSLSLDELHEEARCQFEAFQGSQTDLAEILKINRSAISRAVRNTGMKHAAVQSRIISYVKAVPVQRQTTYLGSKVHHQWIVEP